MGHWSPLKIPDCERIHFIWASLLLAHLSALAFPVVCFSTSPSPSLPLPLSEREHFLKATLLPQKEHGLVPYRLSPSSMNMRPNSLPLQ